MRRRWMKGTMALVSGAALAFAGCGEDDDEVAGGNLERYCELQRELDAEGEARPEPETEEEAFALLESLFGDERVDALIAAAPSEIADEVGAVARAYREAASAGSYEPTEAVAEQEAAMHAFNEDRCGIPNPLGEE